MTKVVFLYHDDANNPCDLMAYFPEDVCSYGSPVYYNCYAHIGQHGSCHPDYAKECRHAKPHEYKELYEELVMIGYNDLVLTFNI